MDIEMIGIEIIKIKYRKFDPQSPPRDRQYNQNVESPNKQESGRYNNYRPPQSYRDTRYRSPPFYNDRGNNGYRSPTPPMNSRAQYLYHDQRNSETGRSSSPQNKRYVDDRPDRQSPNKFSSSSQIQRHESPN